MAGGSWAKTLAQGNASAWELCRRIRLCGVNLAGQGRGRLAGSRAKLAA